jgi:DNA-binding NarL/FixJ family response regulator
MEGYAMNRPQESREGSDPGRALVRVLLVDDQQLVRAGLRALLSSEEDILVVGEAESADASLSQCAKTHPDLLLVDSMLPGMATPALIRKVRARYPATQVLAIAECPESQCPLRQPAAATQLHCPLLNGDHVPGRDCLDMALMAGARGALRKTCSREGLVRAIRTVAPGNYWMELSTAFRVIDGLQNPDRKPEEQEPSEGLTRREVEIVRELISGRSNKQISRTLGITEQSAKNLISRILAKLKLESRVQIAIYAVSTRLLDRYAYLFAPAH